MMRRMHDDHATPRSATARTVALAFLGLASLGFCALGLWQVQRLQWKHALIARVDSRVHAAAVPAPARAQWPAVNVDTSEYLRVAVTGEYLQGRDTRVQALTELGAGFWLLSPLRTDAGDIVLVNRGFLPADNTHPPAHPPAGPVQVQGLLRLSEPGGGVLRRNQPSQQRWYSRDVAAIAAAHGLANTAPYFIDADRDPASVTCADCWPRGGMTVVSFRDHHLQYALTWFGLALLTAFAAWRLLAGDARLLRHNRRDADPQPDQRHRG